MGKKYGATGHGGLTCFHQPKSGPNPQSWESKTGKNMIAPWDSPITGDRNPHQKGMIIPLWENTTGNLPCPTWPMSAPAPELAGGSTGS